MGERGAAAVEFALVSTILFTIVFGILQYGLYFNSTLNAQHGVREAARMVVVDGSSTSCAGSGWSAVSCTVERTIGDDPEDTYIKVSAPEGWAKGKPLVVCAMIRSDADLGVLPLPHDGFVRADLQMSIEQEQTTPAGSGVQDPAPAGQSWGWCA